MLHMFFISQPEDKAKKVPTLLFLHGNAGNVGHRSVTYIIVILLYDVI